MNHLYRALFQLRQKVFNRLIEVVTKRCSTKSSEEIAIFFRKKRRSISTSVARSSFAEFLIGIEFVRAKIRRNKFPRFPTFAIVRKINNKTRNTEGKDEVLQIFIKYWNFHGWYHCKMWYDLLLTIKKKHSSGIDWGTVKKCEGDAWRECSNAYKTSFE